MKPENHEVLSGKTQEPFAVVSLIARQHSTYYGPVHRWAGALWILYGNRPVEVIHRHGCQYAERPAN